MDGSGSGTDHASEGREPFGGAATLEELVGALNAAMTRDQVAEAILGPCARLLGAVTASLALVEPGRRWLRLLGATGLTPEIAREWSRFPMDRDTPLAEAALTGRHILVETLEERRNRYPKLESARAVTDSGPLAAMPLRTGEDAIGALAFTFPAPARSFSDDEVWFLDQLARHCAIALARSDLTDDERRSADQLGLALERTSWLQIVAASLASAVDEAQVFETLQACGADALNASAIAVLEPPDRVVCQTGWPGESGAESAPPGLGPGSAAVRAMRDRVPYFGPADPDAESGAGPLGDALLAVVPFHGPPGGGGSLAALYMEPVSFDHERRGQLAAVSELLGQALERSRLYGSVQAAEERLRAIIDTVADGVLLLDEAGRILSANPAVHRIFGYTPNEVLHAPISTLIPAMVEHESDLYPRAGPSPVELEGRHRDGRAVPLEVAVTLTPVPGRVYTTALIHDMTERKRVEDELRAARRRAAEAEAARRRVLAQLSNEVRTPLTAILGLCDLLVTGIHGPLEPAHADPVQRIRRSGLHLLQIIEEMLVYTDRTTDPPEARQERIDLAETVDEAVRMLEARAGQHGTPVRWEPVDEPIPVLTDPMRLRSLLVHIFGSLARANGEGGIDVRVEAEGEDVLLEIAGPHGDSEIPFAAQLARHAGARFERQHGDRTLRVELRFLRAKAGQPAGD